jgi:hypothetical protein
MKNKNEVLGTINLSPNGVNLVVTNEGGVFDYCEMRTAQLAALTAIVYGEGYESFKLYNEEIQGSLLWLTNGLATEVNKLLPIVCLESEKRAVANLNKNQGAQHE